MTARTRIRTAGVADLPALERSWTDPDVRRYLGGPLTGERLAAKRAHPLQDGDLTVTVHSGRAAGFLQLEPDDHGDIELSFALFVEFWRQGLARESCAAVLGWVQTWASTGTRIVAWTQTANHRSRHLLQALGMTETERFVEYGLAQVRYALPG
jgi:RimJ/RimL family protein N-acetyltransferase